MRVVFVVGFYNPVKTALDSFYREHIESGSIIWVGQKAQGREANLTEFSANYRKSVQNGAEATLIIVATIRGWDFKPGAIENIILACAGPEYQIVTLENAGDRDAVLKHIADFKLLPPPSSLSCENIRAKTPDGKILCVSLANNTSVIDALRRAGFPEIVLITFFKEERIEGARLSGLMEYLSARSKKYGYMLYAFLGLRTLTAEVKGRFKRCYEAPTAAKVAELARRWLEEEE